MLRIHPGIERAEGCCIDPAKIGLLEAIGQMGSLRQAALRLRISYRTVRYLVSDLDRSFSEPITTVTLGGQGGGGMMLTELGKDIVRRYRNAGRRIERILQSDFSDVARKARAN